MKKGRNRVKKIRESLLKRKAELARKARVTNVTIDRIEKRMPCRLETQRKIILALGYKISDKEKIFPRRLSDNSRLQKIRHLKIKTG